jgi:hypothetical protein
MWRGSPIHIALTIDDAPSVCGPGGPELDAGRMDRIREAVLAAGIRHCVAFVIGGRARGHEDSLRRWLDAGFELGNHTEDHVAASAIEPDRFERSVQACHQLLLDVGAFEGGRRRYFRYPFGDRGRRGEARRAIAAAIVELGYTPAEVTVDLYDYAYDAPWTRAHGRRPEATAAVEARWLSAATRSIGRSAARGRRLWGADLIHVAACHFGPVTERRLGKLLRELGARVRWTSLTAASNVPRYQQLVSDLEREGAASELLARGLADRALRRAVQLAHRLGVPAPAALGPRWPHLGP